MATIKNQWVAMCLGTISADLLESLLNKGASTTIIAATAGASPQWLAALLAQSVPAGFNGYPTATPTSSNSYPFDPSTSHLVNSQLPG
jgi:hypothetical protein